MKSTYPEVLKYTSALYPLEDARLLQDIVFENKRDITTLLNQIHNGSEKIEEPSINVIRKNLKKKTKKFIVSKTSNMGNLYTFGANIEDTGTQRLFAVPCEGNPNAMIRFRLFKRSKIMRTLFNKLIMALRSSKVRATTEDIKINNINYIEFSVTNELDNEKFWAILKLWSKN